jgi:hypothetical protein
MNTENFLSNRQSELLESKGWMLTPKNNGKYITLYKDDFTRRAWEEVCQQLDISTQTESVDILYFGISVSNQ